MRCLGRAAIGVAILIVTAGPVAVQGQSAPERLVGTCGSTNPETLALPCGDAGLALQALQGGMGFLMSAGGPVPASPSTAGRRLADSPRIVADGGLGWSTFRHPDLGGATASGGGIGDRRSFLPAFRVTGAMGVFEGFSPIPAVGGVLALDLVGTAQLMRLPRGSGFSGTAMGWGGGARLGVVRESFSLPGVTVSVMHHRAGRVRHGHLDENGIEATWSPRVTSIRTIIGRDLLALGLSAGAGWDRYGGDGRLRVRTTGPGGTIHHGASGPESLRRSRQYLFAGTNFTWIVAQLAGEIAWSRSDSGVANLQGSGSFRPGGSEFQGALTVRITY